MTNPDSVAVVRLMWQAWADDRMDDALATMDPAITWRPSTFPSSDSYVGHEGVRRLRKDSISAHGSYWVAVPELTLQDDGSVKVRSFVIEDDPDARRTPTEIICVLRDGLIVSIDPSDQRDPTDECV